MSLQDETGVFEEIDPPEPEYLSSSEPDDEEEGAEVAALRAEIEQLQSKLTEQKDKMRDLWRLNCEQLAESDNSLAEKEDENARLKEEIACLRRSSPSAHSGTSEGSRHSTEEESSGHS
jgi:predicted RNase H-like nuclease (RuvC/YqgF family)